MNVMQIAEKLIPQVCHPSTPTELHLIESCAGVKLPNSFHTLWTLVGGCNFVAKIVKGKLQGEYVAHFWSSQEILRKLDEDNEIKSNTSAKVIPFADNFWGNTFFLTGFSDIAERVMIVDWNNRVIKPVTDSFDEFLNSLDFQ